MFRFSVRVYLPQSRTKTVQVVHQFFDKSTFHRCTPIGLLVKMGLNYHSQKCVSIALGYFNRGLLLTNFMRVCNSSVCLTPGTRIYIRPSFPCFTDNQFYIGSMEGTGDSIRHLTESSFETAQICLNF